MTRTVRRLATVLTATAMAVTAAMAFDPPGAPQARDPQIGRSFKVPYRLTDTNHFLVRVRINGKGPFNFLVDSGAPALFVSTETAKKIGLKPADAATFWTPIERLDIEGGSRLSNVKARVEDPFQLVGMNALGLPGATIDGILGFTILGRYRLEIDLTQDRMTWTRLKYEPREPPVPRLKPGEKAEAPAGVQAMNALGPLAKGMAFLMGKQPEEKLHFRGFLGVEWSGSAPGGPASTGLKVRRVLGGSPAARAGLQADDVILRINGQSVDRPRATGPILADVRPGDSVALLVRRGSGADARELRLIIKAGEGL
jgi:serine protease Do